MKVLMLSQGRKVEDQPDYDISFRNARSAGRQVELLNIPFIGFVEQYGGEAFYNEVIRANNEFKPDLIFFQFFHSANPGDPTPCVQTLRQSTNNPLVFGSLGDPFDTGLLRCLGRPIPKNTLQLAACADAFFSTSMGNIADALVEHGAKNVVFLPNAFCPMHFPNWDSFEDSDIEHGVVMLCSNGKFMSRLPMRTIKNTWRRRSVVKTMAKSLGSDFSVFGRGWNTSFSKGMVNFKEQVKVYRKSRVVVDAPAPIINTTYYSSDRAFFMLGSGTPLVHFHTPRFEKMLRADDHVYFVDSAEEAVNVCRLLLKMPVEELKDRQRKMIDFVKERHLIDHRVDTIISVCEALQLVLKAQCSSDVALSQIRMWHFLPDVNLKEEYRYATANWCG